MGGPAVRLQARLEIHHLLIGLGCFQQASLFHQYISQQAKVEGSASPGDEFSRDFFAFLESVHVMKHMAAQEKRFRAARAFGLDAIGALLRQLVVA